MRADVGPYLDPVRQRFPRTVGERVNAARGQSITKTYQQCTPGNPRAGQDKGKWRGGSNQHYEKSISKAAT